MSKIMLLILSLLVGIASTAFAEVELDQKYCGINYSSESERDHFIKRALVLANNAIAVQTMVPSKELALAGFDKVAPSRISTGGFNTLKDESLYFIDYFQGNDRVQMILQCDYKFKSLKLLRFQLDRGTTNYDLLLDYDPLGQLIIEGATRNGT